MTAAGTVRRVCAGVIAGAAWAGLLVQCWATYGLTGSLPGTLWVVLAYFTITTNVLVAAVFSAVAVSRRELRREAFLVAGTTLAIALVGVIYALLLRGLVELSGGSAVANELLHVATPVLVPVFWIAFVRKGLLRWRDPLLWAIYPLLYLGYALVRGARTGQYAYPFVNVARLGWGRVGVNAAAIAVAFLLCGWAMVWADGRVGRRERAVPTEV